MIKLSELTARATLDEIKILAARAKLEEIAPGERAVIISALCHNPVTGEFWLTGCPTVEDEEGRGAYVAIESDPHHAFSCLTEMFGMTREQAGLLTGMPPDSPPWHSSIWPSTCEDKELQ
jgi:hypothetical protein